MRVVIHLDGATVRGNERQAMLIGRGLARRGHHVRVACRRGSPVEAYVRAHGLETSGVRPRGDVDLFSLLRFTLWLRRSRPDALLLTSWKRAFTAGLAGRLAGVRVVQRLGGPHPVRPGIRGWKQRLALTRWPHRIVVNSAGLRDQVRAELPGLEPGRVTVVPSGVEPREPEAPAELGSLGVPDGAVAVLAVGGIERLKGYETLIAALARLDGRVHALIAGGGSSARRAALEREAAAAGVAPRLHLLGHRDDVPALLAACHAFVHPSRVDSLPNAVLEAMAAGLPIVATDVPGMDEALRGGDGRPPAGWVVPPGDAGALADALAAALDQDAPAPVERAREARRRAREELTLEAMFDGYEAALRGEGGA